MAENVVRSTYACELHPGAVRDGLSVLWSIQFAASRGAGRLLAEEILSVFRLISMGMRVLPEGEALLLKEGGGGYAGSGVAVKLSRRPLLSRELKPTSPVAELRVQTNPLKGKAGFDALMCVCL